MSSRAAELAEIERHISTRGVARCPPAFAEAVTAALPRAQEAQRIANFSVQATLTHAENTAQFTRWLRSLRR